MKILRDIIDKVKGPFQKGEKFEKFAPAVNAFDTFLFVQLISIFLFFDQLLNKFSPAPIIAGIPSSLARIAM